MSSTPFSDRCKIITEFSENYGDSEEDMWVDYFATYNLGVPLALAIVYGGATANERGMEWINAAWIALCEIIEIDHYGEYSSMMEMMDFAEAE